MLRRQHLPISFFFISYTCFSSEKAKCARGAARARQASLEMTCIGLVPTDVVERGVDSWEVKTRVDARWSQLLPSFHVNLPRNNSLEEGRVYEHSNAFPGKHSISLPANISNTPEFLPVPDQLLGGENWRNPSCTRWNAQPSWGAVTLEFFVSLVGFLYH